MAVRQYLVVLLPPPPYLVMPMWGLLVPCSTSAVLAGWLEERGAELWGAG